MDLAGLRALRPSLLIALTVGVGGALFVSIANWGGRDVTFDGLLVTTIGGLSVGSLYALSATGLVVVYNTTGTFNFAHGGIGVFSAFAYWELVENRDGLGLPSWLGLLVVVLVLAPAIGALLDVVLHWAGEGVRIFRVDNPHTKPFRFWEWLIAESRRVHPDLVFLSDLGSAWLSGNAWL